LWRRHQAEPVDATFMDDIIDGCGFEIIALRALEESHSKGEKKHRSELCTLYIREHLQQFKVIKANPPQELIRKDLRLTVDNPEDLAICRVIYRAFKDLAPKIPIADIVKFLDKHPKLIEMVTPYTVAGYATMYR